MSGTSNNRNSQSPLFSGSGSAVENSGTRAAGPVPATGILVTNHLNLMYMLASGLLMPPSGFRGKHYGDTLAAFPGWLPLFVAHGRGRAGPPRAALERSVEEATHLRPVILEVDLAGLQGPVHVHGEGEWVKRRLEEGVSDREWLLLLPAPLPISRIRRIVFRSLEEKRAVEARAGEHSNVDLAGLARRSLKSWFPGTPDPAWPPEGGPEEREAAVERAQAAGGVLAVLHEMANTGELSVRTCRSAFDPSEPSDDSILGELPGWMHRVGGAEDGRPARSGRDLFWGAVNQLVEHRREPGGRRPEDVLISFLSESSEGMDAGVQARGAALVSTLEALGGGLGSGTVSEMLDQHRRPLARAAILFLLRRRTRDLLELVEDYPQLEERDRLAAAILFGVRDGWLKLPIALRGSREFQKTVTHRMAAQAHRLDGSGFDLGEAPPRVRPLRELFGGSDAWDAKTNKAAVRLARGMKWDCVRTTVSLPRGTYEFRIEGGSAHIDFQGEPWLRTEVERDRFFELLASSRIKPGIASAVRRQLGM